jgi:hypothetical protein
LFCTLTGDAPAGADAEETPLFVVLLKTTPTKTPKAKATAVKKTVLFFMFLSVLRIIVLPDGAEF